ncbi:hypothetical protein FK529_04685 [Tsukamurella asaccharolytica]|uniref:Uncharacterized protein n=1 Tax=Tsukamurella asaccharolytica TaxID=2592067 RepID=A0A5C5RDZ1_9ACTN|nr:hypothetical protein [Tsukamurella asaccharolytica]TWS20643.1 hypothetical protein FK529_04685 [Tsukamurella asaccharolytica]
MKNDEAGTGSGGQYLDDVEQRLGDLTVEEFRTLTRQVFQESAVDLKEQAATALRDYVGRNTATVNDPDKPAADKPDPALKSGAAAEEEPLAPGEKKRQATRALRVRLGRGDA